MKHRFASDSKTLFKPLSLSTCCIFDLSLFQVRGRLTQQKRKRFYSYSSPPDECIAYDVGRREWPYPWIWIGFVFDLESMKTLCTALFFVTAVALKHTYFFKNFLGPRRPYPNLIAFYVDLHVVLSFKMSEIDIQSERNDRMNIFYLLQYPVNGDKSCYQRTN